MAEVETIYGNKVMIPSRFINGWQTAKMIHQRATELGQDPLDGLEVLKETQPLSYDLEKVFYEIYETED